MTKLAAKQTPQTTKAPRASASVTKKGAQKGPAAPPKSWAPGVTTAIRRVGSDSMTKGTWNGRKNSQKNPNTADAAMNTSAPGMIAKIASTQQHHDEAGHEYGVIVHFLRQDCRYTGARG